MVNSKTHVFIDNNEPLIGIIVIYHLQLEGLIDNILEENLVEPGVLDFERMMFVQKASLACAIGKIDLKVFEVIKKLNALRNKFSHQLDFTPSFEELHELIVSANQAGVDFSEDGIYSSDPNFAKKLVYHEETLLNMLYRNIFNNVAGRQG
jgi:hypothetical protein